MKQLALLLSVCFVVGGIFLAGRHKPVVQSENSDNKEVMDVSDVNCGPAGAVCFAPGTPEDYIAQWQERIWGNRVTDFRIGSRWEETASGPTGSQGTGITLTYSFVPDGVTIEGSPSQLFSRMNTLFGNPQAWQNLIHSVFSRWGELSGINFVFSTDDGASFRTSPGQLGVRGDVRIGSIPIDGPSGVLAYNYFPDIGDMVLDAGEDWSSPGRNYIFLRNIVSHEHGHGWGLSHVCPANGTKLLEPFYSSGFDGPQHDDIRAVQRNYGDAYEPNESAAAAIRLGLLAADTVLQHVSIDRPSDQDFWKFRIPAGRGMTVALVPDGYEYLEGPQLQNGDCSAGTIINSVDDLNLDLFLYNGTGSTLLAQSANQPAGQTERIFRYAVPLAGDSFVVKVTGGGTNTVQLYRLEFDVYNSSDPHLTVSPLNFDTSRVGTPVTRQTVLVNNAQSALQVTSLTATAPFTVSPSAPQSVPVGGSLTLSVTFPSAVPGAATGALTIQHSGPGQVLECPLSAMATDSWLEFVTTDIADFGDVGWGDTDSARVPVRARGNVSLTIQSFATTPPFSMHQSVPQTLLANQTFFLQPRFRPTGLGDFTGLLIINHTGRTSPDTVFLRGTSIPAAVEADPAALPRAFRVAQNYPNPFNAVTRIAFDLPRAADITLRVFDIQGRRVRELAAGEFAAGRHTLNFDGAGLASGVYLYRVSAPGFSGGGKMLLLK